MNGEPKPGSTRSDLPLITSCDGCGACCLVVVRPPFVRNLDGTGGSDWERLVWERPDLVTELVNSERDRRAEGRPDHGSACLWYEPGTRRCRHHEFRPRACREFALGGTDCRDARRRAGIGRET